MPPKGSKRKALDAGGMQKINDSYYTVLGNAVSRVLANKAFTNIRSKDPLIIGQGGSRPAFDKDAFKAAFKDKRSEQYITAGNASWMNEMWNPLHGVPLNMANVKVIAEHNYQTYHMEPGEQQRQHEVGRADGAIARPVGGSRQGHHKQPRGRDCPRSMGRSLPEGGLPIHHYRR